MYRECSKEIAECAYRFDYRGCNKGNCPFPNEYEQIKPKIVEDRIELNLSYYKKDSDFRDPNYTNKVKNSNQVVNK